MAQKILADCCAFLGEDNPFAESTASVRPVDDSAPRKVEIKWDPVPTEENVEQQQKPTKNEFISAPAVTEEVARQALQSHVSQHFCWGSGAARDLTYKKIVPSTSYHYILQTFTEDRSTVLSHIPYMGQTLDTSSNGKAPDQWEVDLKPKAIFEGETREVKLPHTSYSKECHVCGASGETKCPFCKGSGRQKCNRGCGGRGVKKEYDKNMHDWKEVRCDPCHGTGEMSCSSCHGSGKRRCYDCDGHRHLEWFAKLTVTWSTNTGEYVMEKSSLPKEMVGLATGTTGFQDTRKNVIPLKEFPEEEINRESQRLIGEHKFPKARILMQRHQIRMIPVTQCHCTYKQKDMSYFVFGLENNVHAPEYPQQMCCGCTLL